jgi:hypothetical protein
MWCQLVFSLLEKTKETYLLCLGQIMYAMLRVISSLNIFFFVDMPYRSDFPSSVTHGW